MRKKKTPENSIQSQYFSTRLVSRWLKSQPYLFFMELSFQFIAFSKCPRVSLCFCALYLSFQIGNQLVRLVLLLTKSRPLQRANKIINKQKTLSFHIGMYLILWSIQYFTRRELCFYLSVVLLSTAITGSLFLHFHVVLSMSFCSSQASVCR